MKNTSLDSHSHLYSPHLPHPCLPLATLNGMDEAATEGLSQKTLMRTPNEDESDVGLSSPPPFVSSLHKFIGH